MKTILLFGLILLFAIACNTDRQPLLDMTVLKDSTDEIPPLSYEDVRQFLDYSNTELIWYEVSIAQRELTDVRYGTIANSHLPKGEPNQTTEQQRKVVVKRFLKETESMLNQELVNGHKEQSHLYFGIAEELNKLTKSTSLRKIAVISSNLLENTKTFSVYRPQDQKLLLEHPDSVIRLFHSELPLDDLTGVSVYIVYPAIPDDHELFLAMSRLYKTMLTRKGARVHIAGNLIPETLSAP